VRGKGEQKKKQPRSKKSKGDAGENRGNGSERVPVVRDVIQDIPGGSISPKKAVRICNAWITSRGPKKGK